MLENSKINSAKWVPSKDLDVIAKLCEYFNKGKVYEIFWEYCNLTADILYERNAQCWLYYENDMLSGFALGRFRGKIFVFEEVWGPCDGIREELTPPSKRDNQRILQFKSLADSLNFNVPMLLRAAIDNQFTHLLARTLKASWVNGLIIAERILGKQFEFSIPSGYKLRMFKDGDQFDMTKIHEEVYGRIFSPKDYRTWATGANCHTIIATHYDELIGFLIAEKRRCGSLGDFAIAIKPLHQGKGMGSTLLKAAFNVFVDMGVKKVIADYLKLNTPAYKLYQKHKFKPKRIYNYFLYAQ